MYICMYENCTCRVHVHVHVHVAVYVINVLYMCTSYMYISTVHVYM